MANNITLQEFIEKAQNKVKNRKMTTDIDIPSMECSLTFMRPSEDELLEYMNEISKSIKVDKNKTVIETDMIKMFEASKRIVYSNCEYLKSKELQDALGIVAPLDILSKLFGAELTIKIAEKIYEDFSDTKVSEVIKN